MTSAGMPKFLYTDEMIDDLHRRVCAKGLPNPSEYEFDQLVAEAATKMGQERTADSLKMFAEKFGWPIPPDARATVGAALALMVEALAHFSAETMEEASESDRTFFEDHPDRTMRLRLPALEEITETTAVGPPPNLTLVVQIEPGQRLRLPFTFGDSHFVAQMQREPIDPGEAQCQHLLTKLRQLDDVDPELRAAVEMFLKWKDAETLH
jgi:hypothetical protein